MSTRGTYQFDTLDHHWPKLTTTLYIHHDNYPEGAAQHFRAALESDGNGAVHAGLVDLMICATAAHITGSHGSHGDTEFRYTVSTFQHEPPVLFAEKRIDFTENWGRIFYGPLIDFVNQYAPKAPAE